MIGSRLGPYEITAKLGEGGMGEVYRARDGKLGREVALKVLLAGQKASAKQIARFHAEARSAARLRHPLARALSGHVEVPAARRGTGLSLHVPRHPPREDRRPVPRPHSHHGRGGGGG